MSIPTYASMLAEKRAQLRAEAHKIIDPAAAEKRELTAGEQSAFDSIVSDLKSQDQAGAAVAERAASTASASAVMRQLADTPRDPASGYTGPTATRGQSVDPELNERFRRAILTRDLSPIEVMPTETRSGYCPGVERRNLGTGSGSGMVPTSFWGVLQRVLVDNSAILAAGATIINSQSGEPLKVPKSTANSTAAIVAEAGLIPGSDPTLGTAALGAYKYGFIVQISRELVEDGTFDVAGYLAAQAGTALANGAGAHFVSGTGTGQPTGAVTGATLGITGATGVTGAFTADNLIDLYHSIAEPYARSQSAGWLMRNSSLAAVRKLKDSQNRYLFSTDAPYGTGASGTLLGRPVYADPNVAAVGLGAKSVIFGDFSKYWVRSVNGVRFDQSIDYAFGNDLITYRSTWRADGTLVDTTGALKFFAGGAS